jgi:dipeptidyl-peptidase-4
VKRAFRLLLLWPLLLSFAVAQADQSKKPLTIESIVAPGGITGELPQNLAWSPDNSRLAYLLRGASGENADLWSVDVATGEKKLLVSADKLSNLAPPPTAIKNALERERVTRYHVASFLWAPDSRHLLFSPEGQLWLYTLENGTAVPITSNPDPSTDPKFSPDGRRVAFLRDHNLYVHSVSGKSEKQLTKDTDANLLNGEVDWVYAEELSVRSNYFWSPDGKQIAYLQMDETKVPTYPITNWLPTHPTLDQQKYPQPGDPNPAVKIGVVEASGGKTRWISLTDDSDIYIPRFGWVREGILWAEVMNRAQTQLDLYFIDASNGHSRKMLTESDPTGWINVNDDFSVLSTGDRFLWSSWRDGNTHLYFYSFDKQDPLAAPATLDRQLTHGNFEVLGVQSVGESAGLVYFLCNKDDPRQQQLYSVKLDGSGLQRVSTDDGVHAVSFSPDSKHFVDHVSSLTIPPQFSLCTPGGPCKQFWQSSTASTYNLAPTKFLEFKAADGTLLYGQLLLPPQSTSSEKIPLVINIYGGPAAQLVLNEWGGLLGAFNQILVHQGFAVFSVDNRGTPNRDRKFQVAIRHQFGAVELKDQLTALDQLLSEYPQLDRSRIGIWGWSNGGSMTLYAMTHSDVFKAGVSVAPVTDWHDYDSIYTERWLGTPHDNPQGYADPMAKDAAKLHGSLLLVHGSSDDNVHLQNSIQMIQGLILAGKQFRFMTYPDKTHSISGTPDRDHLFHMIDDHFLHDLK